MNGVAISGRAGAGKNAFAHALAERLVARGVWMTEVNFAEGVKRELLECYGMVKEDPGGRDKLLEIGHGRRLTDPDYWVRAMQRRVDSLRPFGAFPVVTDMRYLNEYEWARRSGFLTVRVDATPMDRRVVLAQRGEDPDFAYSEHPSEIELDDVECDIRFWNPHGDSGFALAHYAGLVTQYVLGEVELAA